MVSVIELHIFGDEVGFVTAAVIDDEDLILGIGEGDKTLERRLEDFLFIVAWDKNRDQGE
ncbi:hypothetical protein D3C81_2016370 [compost metagenome]